MLGDSLRGLTTAPSRTVPVPIALRIAAQVCAALHAAPRSASIDTIFVTDSGDVTLADTGPAPPRDRTADVGTVGAILFRMLSANDPGAAALPAEIPPAVVAIVTRAIAPNVHDRFPSTLELQQAIEAVLAREVPPPIGAWVQANLSEEARRRAAAPPPEPSAPAAPGFMDVGALVANARRGPPPAAAPGGPPPAAHAGPAPTAPAPQEPQLELAVAPRRAAPAPRSNAPLKIALAVLAIILVLGGLVFLAPIIVRDRAIATAREAGFVMTVGRVGVGFGGATFREVQLKATRTPGITITADELFIAGITGKEVRARGLALLLDGERTDLQVGLGAILADSRARFAGSASSPRHVSIVGARMSWVGPPADGLRLDASDIGVEVDSRGAGAEEVRGMVGRFELKTAQASFGPWAATFETAPKQARVRLMLDPPVPDGPSALVVWGHALPTELTVKIPRTPFKNIGIDPAQLGIPADAATETEVQIHGQLRETDRSELTALLVLWAARPQGFGGPVDIRAEGAATGAPGKPLDLEKTTVSLGPFVANVTGTIAAHERGLRLDALFKTLPLACEKLAQAEAKKAGALAQAFQALGQATGVVRITGNVNVSGVVAYDTAAPDQASVSWLAKETCGLSIFGL